MSEYNLRLAFPLRDRVFAVNGRRWTCQLAEVSDLRPEEDRLSWYLVFLPDAPPKHIGLETRKLELVTSAGHLLKDGWPEDVENRLTEWLESNQEDGRLEWLTG